MEEPFSASASGFYVVGLEVRTSKALEDDPQTARVPALWERFGRENLAEQIPRRLAKGHPFCVYFDYQYPAEASFRQAERGVAYSVVLGYQVPSLEDVPPGLRGLYVPGGKYLVFSTEPQKLAQAWTDIQNYFTQPGKPQRAFTYDYEEYFCQNAPCDEVRIYVALC